MKHLVIIGLVIPEPASTAAGQRMLQLIRLFKSWDYKVTFLTAAKNDVFSEKIDFQKIELNDDSFDELIKNLAPDVVLFDRYISEEQFGWRVSEMCPNALKILDTEDLHFLREARKKAFLNGTLDAENHLINDVFFREMASILRCDLSLVISKYEMNLLQERFKINPHLLFYLPFLNDLTAFFETDFSKRKHFVSIGNFLHEPNWQTVLQLKKIWKNIRKKLPDSELHIYGAYAGQKVQNLHNVKEGFIIKGRAESVEKIFNEYRILLAPIPFGAGLKGKIWESMKFGLPNVTTSIGAEGMNNSGIWNGLIEDDQWAFSDAAVSLYTNENLWDEARKHGFDILNSQFLEQDFAPIFKKRVENLLESIGVHRTENFIGQILQHQNHQATKYMSRWIQEKQRSKNQ